MIEQIKKAISSGFEVLLMDVTEPQEKLIRKYGGMTKEDEIRVLTAKMNSNEIYRVLFGTDFLGKLCENNLKWERREACMLEMPCESSCEKCLDGDGEKCIVCSMCDLTITDHDDDYYYNKDTGKNYCEICFEKHEGEELITMSAAYHRAQLLGMTRDQMINYINTL